MIGYSERMHLVIRVAGLHHAGPFCAHTEWTKGTDVTVNSFLCDNCMRQANPTVLLLVQLSAFDAFMPSRWIKS
jgi:hypothetical protein